MAIASKKNLLFISQIILITVFVTCMLFMYGGQNTAVNSESNENKILHKWRIFDQVEVSLDIAMYTPPDYIPGLTEQDPAVDTNNIAGTSMIIVNLKSTFFPQPPVIDNFKEASWNSPLAEIYSFSPESQVIEEITYYLINTETEFFLLLEFNSLHGGIEIIETGILLDLLDLQIDDSLMLQLTLVERSREWSMISNVRLQTYEQYVDILEKNTDIHGPKLSITDSGHVVVNEIGYDGTDRAEYTYETPGNDTNFTNLIITEVMYYPPGVEEWIELYNPTGSTVDLSGWTLNNSINVFNLSGNILSGDYFVFTKDSTAFQALYPSAGLPDQVNSTLDLANNGDYIALNDNLSTEVDYMAWKNGDVDWKTLSTKETTVRRFSLTDTDTVSDWEDSGTIGDPGSGIFAHAYNTTLFSERDEYLTIYNPTVSAVSLSNWIFSNGNGTIGFNNSITINGDSGLIIAKDADSFYQRFGIDADYEWNATWGEDQTNNATVPDLLVLSGEINLTNAGGYVYLDDEVTDTDSTSVDIVVWETLTQDFSGLPEGDFTGTLPSICLEGQAISRVNLGQDGSELNENNEDLATTFETITVSSSNPPSVSEFGSEAAALMIILANSALLMKKRPV